MNKLLKSILISFAGAIVIMFFMGCTPGKAQTKGNDYKGSFQNEEFEAFDNNSSNDDEIPAMNKKTKSSYSGDKYANNSKDYENKKMRVKSGGAKSKQGSDDYQEAKGDYQDAEDNRDESYSKVNKNNKNYEDDSDSQENEAEKFYQKGYASWYGREFHGKTTASGEIFDMNEMTAAHKTLPFGTIVEVKNLSNGKSVRMKINDRGPYRGNRIIDLSFAGAREIGIVKSGEATVGIKILKKGNSNSASNSGKKYIEPVADDENYMNVKSESQDDYNNSSNNISALKLQAGAFYSRKNAENLKSKIEGMTSRHVRIIQDGDFYKVRVEGLRDKKEMSKLRNLLNEDNVTSFEVE